MLSSIASLDRALAWTRPAWAGLGQLALVVLGVHLAADRLDEHVLDLLLWLGVPGGADALRPAATLGAVTAEILVVFRAALAIALVPPSPQLSLREWARGLSVEALVLPAFWLPAAAAGAWVVGMGLRDALPEGPWSLPAAVGLGTLVGWRLGWTGLRRAIGGLGTPRSRLQGLLWSPLLLGAAWLVLREGLPLWGWLS